LKTKSLPRLLLTGGTFALSFGLGRGSAFLAALAIPRMVDAHIYGTIELALTVGSLGATLVGLGGTAVAVKFHLVDNDPRANAVLFGHCLWLCAVALAGAGVVAALDWHGEYACGVAMIGLFGFQASGGAFARMRGHVHLTGWVESSSIFALFIVAIAFTQLGGLTVRELLCSAFVIVLAIGIASAIAFFRAKVGDIARLVVQTVSIGAPMMIFGLSQALLFGTPRLAIAKQLTLNDVACFSLCARIALVLVFASQVLSIGLFRSVYRMEGASIGRYFKWWIAALSVISMTLTIAAYFGAPLAVKGTDIPAATFVALFPAAAMQTTLWVLNSNLEMFIVRDLLSRQAAMFCFAIVAAGLLVAAVVSWLVGLGLMAIIGIYSLAMLAMLLVQMRLLASKGVRFGGTYLVLPMVMAPCLIYLFPAGV
jgi:hypothetical protein